jgi:hypothetical protein
MIKPELDGCFQRCKLGPRAGPDGEADAAVGWEKSAAAPAFQPVGGSDGFLAQGMVFTARRF